MSSQFQRIDSNTLRVTRADRTRLSHYPQYSSGHARQKNLHAHIATPYGLIRDAFAAAQARGEIGACNLDLVLTLFLSMIEGQIKGAGIGVVIDLPPEDLARTIVGLLMDGIAVSPPSPMAAGG